MMRRFLAGPLAALFAAFSVLSLPAPASALAIQAIQVTTCGTEVTPISNGQLAYIQIDANGNVCTSSVGGGGGGAVTVANGADVTLGAKADAKSTATDTTSITMMQVLKEISAMVQAPPLQAGNASPMQATGGVVQANAGTNLNTSALALETGGNLASIKADVDKIPASPAQEGGNLATVATNTNRIPAQGSAAKAASTPVIMSTDTALCPSSVAINQTASTDVLTLTNKAYVCGVILITASAQSVSLVEGTGSVCATGIAALLGGTTASMAFGANGGIDSVTGTPWLKSKTAADHLCVLQSGAGNVSGVITYADLP